MARPPRLPRRALSWWRLGVSGAVAGLVAVAACGFPEVTIVDGAAGAGGAGAGGGDAGECDQPADCASPADPCLVPTCDAGACGIAARATGDACGVDLVCDEMGLCVACRGNQDCGADICAGGTCVPDTCGDTTQNGDETDEDCGGSVCPRCADGGACIVATDCMSGFCQGTVCTPCSVDAHCEALPGTYCDTGPGVCTPEKGSGIVCARDGECASGHCPSDDFVCCDTACTDNCEGCLQGKTGAANGTCAPISAGTDPDEDCLLGECSAGVCF